MSQMPEWITYDAAADTLTIHGRRYSAAMFGERGFLSPPGTLLRVERGPADVVTLSSAPQPVVGDGKVPVPADVMEARAQGRAEALAIILGLDPEEGLDEYTNSIPPGPSGEWGTAWDQERLRELLRADDTAWSLLQEAEGEYWHQLGLREEAERLSAKVAAPSQPQGGEFDLRAHLQRQREWSERTFGPGSRAKGVVDHIRKELREIEADPTDLSEWIDVAILALDGAWRSGATPEQIIAALVAKQTRNEGRTWPDWRTADPDKAIEHERGDVVEVWFDHDMSDSWYRAKLPNGDVIERTTWSGLATELQGRRLKWVGLARYRPEDFQADAAGAGQAGCDWTFEDEPTWAWNTGCGETFQFNDGGPSDNNFRYCHGCGEPIATHTQEPDRG